MYIYCLYSNRFVPRASFLIRESLSAITRARCRNVPATQQIPSLLLALLHRTSRFRLVRRVLLKYPYSQQRASKCLHPTKCNMNYTEIVTIYMCNSISLIVFVLLCIWQKHIDIIWLFHQQGITIKRWFQWFQINKNVKAWLRHLVRALDMQPMLGLFDMT